MTSSYQIRWSHGATDSADTYGEALAAVRSVLSEPVIGHAGDISEGGDSTLVWASESLAQDDDGSRASARIVEVQS